MEMDRDMVIVKILDLLTLRIKRITGDNGEHIERLDIDWAKVATRIADLEEKREKSEIYVTDEDDYPA